MSKILTEKVARAICKERNGGWDVWETAAAPPEVKEQYMKQARAAINAVRDYDAWLKA